MPIPPFTRRLLLGSAAALAVTAPPGPSSPAPHPDAALIEACERHIKNFFAFNYDEGDDEDAHEALGQLYDESLDAVGELRPVTLAGIVAKARATKVEGTHPDGSHDVGGTPAADWALDIINDLLRLFGEVAP